ncbi:hypothetical protein VTI74DRAFT_7127 [Chaetomium olivicolor]
MATDYPPPLIIAPRVLPHKQTFILLHGRGSWADKFGPVLLDTPISIPPPTGDDAPGEQPPTAQTLATAFPHARFVFPTAARRRATIYRRAHTHQWFDNWVLEPPHAADREELQVPGLRETTTYLHGLLLAEIAAVPGGAANVVLGGLSQGCAAALVALLLWEGPLLAAAIGMCGWLPFAARLAEEAGGARAGNSEEMEEGAVEEDDIFDRGENGDWRKVIKEEDPMARAMRWLRAELGLPECDARVSSPGTAFQQTPVFLGHGVEDDRVNVILGRNATACLETLGVGTICWKEYEGLSHWYSGEMLQDLVGFVRASTKWNEM